MTTHLVQKFVEGKTSYELSGWKVEVMEIKKQKLCCRYEHRIGIEDLFSSTELIHDVFEAK